MSSDLDIYKKHGFGGTLGLGERPSLCIVDFFNGVMSADDFGGCNIPDAIENTVPLLDFCRERGMPVAYTRIVFAEDGSDYNLLTEKVPSIKAMTEDAHAGQIVPQLEPKPGELIIRKRNASAFFQTDYTGWLSLHNLDTVLVTGCVTSGCVRATTLDALGYGFRPIVVTDCVGDRALGPHEANLFDMGQKYADLMTSEEVMAALDKVKRAAAE